MTFETQMIAEMPSAIDTTKKGMEFIETFPEEEFDAGEAGKKSNWFDKLCNFFSGLFGG